MHTNLGLVCATPVDYTLNITTEPFTCVHLGIAAHLPLLANLRNVPFMFLKATAVARVAPTLAAAQGN